MSLKLNSSGGGSVLLQEPSTASNRTLTLPDADGTVIYSDASANLQFNSGYGSVATAYGCRAWVNFNGTGTVAIRASGNVSSITDVGVGYYTVNFTASMPDANFSACCSGRNQASTTLPLVSSAVSFSTTSVNLRFLTPANADQDSDFVSAAVFR
jgi:hypothetical protein